MGKLIRYSDVKRHRDSAISEGVKKVATRVKEIANGLRTKANEKMSSIPSEKLTIKALIKIGAAAVLAALIARISVGIISSIYQGRKISDDIASGRLTEEQFVRSYKEEYEKEYNELRAAIIREYGVEARDPQVMAQFLGDILEQRPLIMNARTISDLYNATGELKLREIMKQFDKARTSTKKIDRMAISDSLNLMCRRMPGARYCANQYGRKHSIRDAAHALGVHYAMRENKRRADHAMMRYDKFYRDGVIDIAKEKVKNAIAKAKKFAKNNPKLMAALGGMLVALGTGSAVAIHKARRRAYPEIIDVKFEWIGPEADKSEKSDLNDKLKDAFSWMKKAEESFDEKSKRFK